MRIAYLILTHANPKDLSHLIKALKTDLVGFFIHVDKKCDIELFFRETQNINANINFCKSREDGQWGDIGIVKATINLIKEAYANNFDYYILLSGTDFPIKSNSQIIQFFELHKYENFISFEKLPIKTLNYGGLDRVMGYSYTIKKKRQTFVPYKLNPDFNFKGQVLNFLLGVFSFFKGKRKTPSYINHFYYGSQWWMLNNDAISYIVSFLTNHPDYVNFHHHTLLPDEVFFQTILLNNTSESHLKFSNDNFRHIIWEVGSNHPKIIQLEDYDSLLRSSSLFARKFDLNSEIVSKIEKNVLSC